MRHEISESESLTGFLWKDISKKSIKKLHKNLSSHTVMKQLFLDFNKKFVFQKKNLHSVFLKLNNRLSVKTWRQF